MNIKLETMTPNEIDEVEKQLAEEIEELERLLDNAKSKQKGIKAIKASIEAGRKPYILLFHSGQRQDMEVSSVAEAIKECERMTGEAHMTTYDGLAFSGQIYPTNHEVGSVVTCSIELA